MTQKITKTEQIMTSLFYIMNLTNINKSIVIDAIWLILACINTIFVVKYFIIFVKCNKNGDVGIGEGQERGDGHQKRERSGQQNQELLRNIIY